MEGSRVLHLTKVMNIKIILKKFNTIPNATVKCVKQFNWWNTIRIKKIKYIVVDKYMQTDFKNLIEVLIMHNLLRYFTYTI